MLHGFSSKNGHFCVGLCMNAPHNSSALVHAKLANLMSHLFCVCVFFLSAQNGQEAEDKEGFNGDY